MGLFSHLFSKRRRAVAPRTGLKAHHRCRLEQFESRRLMAVDAAIAPIQLGSVYYEDSSGDDEAPDTLQFTFTGGAPGTQLTELTVDTDKFGDGLTIGDVFWDTASGGQGDFNSQPMLVVSQNGFNITGASLVDGGTLLKFTFTGFDAGETLTISVDVDEKSFKASNATAEGDEFEGSILTGKFTAPHYFDAQGSDIYLDEYDPKFAGSGLPLPADIYSPPNSEATPVRTAGALVALTQTPLPISLSGRVHQDLDGDCLQDPGEQGIAGVQLTLERLLDGAYVSTGRTATTDANGDYEFDDLAPGTYRVVESQPGGYLSVGAKPGNVDGQTRGVAVGSDILAGIELNGGDDSVRNDFCETLPASICGYVYHDRNDNGLREAGEEGIAGVTVDVMPVGGTPGSAVSVITDANGRWCATDLTPGTYTAMERHPSSWIDGKDTVGDHGGDGSVNDKLQSVTLAAGVNADHYNFGELLPASIRGQVHADNDGDCVLDAGEQTIAGVTIELRSNGALVATTVTDAQGKYSFDNLRPGAYSVHEIQPGGYLQGGAVPGTLGGVAVGDDQLTQIALQSGDNSLENNFCEVLPTGVQGQVFVDTNNDCIRQVGEEPIAGVTIWLLDSQGNRIASTTTDANGKYEFTNLRPGKYSLEEVHPGSYLQGGQTAGSAGGNVSQDKITDIQLLAGQLGVNYDFCEVKPARLSGYVFQDGPPIVYESLADLPNKPFDLTGLKDGARTSDDIPLSGIRVILADGSGIPLENGSGGFVETTTDANGYYEFNNLTPGTYTVMAEQPDNYLTGVDTAGSTGGVVFNEGSGVEENSVLSAVDPEFNYIAQITLKGGEHSIENNFSEVLVQADPPQTPPPSFNVPDPNPPIVQTVPGPVLGAPINPQVLPPATPPGPHIIWGAGLGATPPLKYTWHLSVVNAGSPRASGKENEALVQRAKSKVRNLMWYSQNLTRAQWLVDRDGDGRPDQFNFGAPEGVPVVGDFNGDGQDEFGVYIDGEWFIDVNGNAVWDDDDLWAQLGTSSDQPVTGDWDGDGKTDIGIFGHEWPGDQLAIQSDPGLPDPQNPVSSKLKNIPPDARHAAQGQRLLKKTSGGDVRSDVIDHVFEYGEEGHLAITGDWNGDGIDQIGIYGNGTFVLDTNGNGRLDAGDTRRSYGVAGGRPVVGDFNGDGVDDLAIYQAGRWRSDTNANGRFDATDQVFNVGQAGDSPVAGDWNGDGVDEPGVYRGGKLQTTTEVSQR